MCTVVDEWQLRNLGKFDTVKEAEDFIAWLEKIIPDDVHAGRFGVDCTEVNDRSTSVRG